MIANSKALLPEIDSCDVKVVHVVPSLQSEHCASIGPFALVFNVHGIEMEEAVSWTLLLFTGEHSHLRSMGWLSEEQIDTIHAALEEWLNNHGQSVDQNAYDYVEDYFSDPIYDEEMVAWGRRWRTTTPEEEAYFFRQSRKFPDEQLKQAMLRYREFFAYRQETRFSL